MFIVRIHAYFGSSIYEADDLRPAVDEDQCFITEDQIPDKYLPETILYRRAAGIDNAEKKK